jgi:hypothetical protein
MEAPKGEGKREVLTTLYSQLHQTATTIRDYMIKLTTATSALFIALDGWILAEKVVLQYRQRVGLIFGVALLVLVATAAAYRFYREFQAVAKLIVRVERGLRVYEPDYYLPGESLYPSDYARLGENSYEHGWHILFGPVLIMFVLGLFSVLILVLF